MQTIYLNQFSLAAALRVALFRIGQRGLARLVYLEEGRGLRAAKPLLSLSGVKAFEHCKLGPADLTDANGSNLFLRKEDAINRVAAQLLARADWRKVTAAFDTRYNAENLRMDLRRRVSRDLYVELGRYLVLKRLSELAGGNVAGAIVLKWSPFIRDIMTVLEGGPRLIVYPGCGRILAAVREILAALRQTLRGRRDVETEPAVPGTIAVQYSLGLDLGERSDLAWLAASGIDPQRILLFVDGRPAHQAAPIIAEAKAMGVRAITLADWQPAASDQDYARELAAMWRAFARLATGSRGLPLRGRLWLLSGLLSFARGHARWSSFFRTQDVKIFVNSGDSDTLLVAKTAAIEGRGGVDVSFQFSNTGWILPTNARPLNQHQFFSWGRANAEMVLWCDAKCPVKAPNVFFFGGHIYQYVTRYRQAEMRSEVQSLRDAGCRFVILAFDSACGRDVPPTPRANEEFYRTLVAIAAADPEIGLLIKPYSIPVMGGETAATLEVLKSAGRALQLPSSVRPFHISAHVDLAIGVGAGNSALIEAATVETPHISYDNYAWNEHVFYGRPLPPVMAQDARGLESIVQAHKTGVARAWLSDPAYRSYLDWLDPFRDGRGHERFGRLIAFMTEAIDRHRDATRAMPEIVARYCEAYGHNAVQVVRWPYAGKPPLSAAR